MEINKLLLLSGGDVPFAAAQVTIHQPKLKEIAIIGEENFFIGARFLLFSKDDISSEDKVDLSQIDDFDIFMSIMNSKEKIKHKLYAIQVLTLMFPDIKFKIEKDKILLQLENFESSINKENFKELQSAIQQMFFIDEEAKDQFNPADALAQKIANKIKKGQEKRAKSKGQLIDKEVRIIERNASILAVGMSKDINQLMDYTLYQLFAEYKRYQKKVSYDLMLQAKIAGATGLEEVDNWMED